MPARQRGSVVKRGPRNWQARYRDEDNQQRGQSGFETKTEAGEWLDDKLREVAALRRGEHAALRRRNPPTLLELVDEFLGQHNAEKNTMRGLRELLAYATREDRSATAKPASATSASTGSTRPRSAHGGSGYRNAPHGASTRRSGKS